MNRLLSAPRWHPLVATLAMSGLICGCDAPEPIRKYTVERPAPEHRMWAAIVRRADQNWFFKVTGARELLSERTEELTEFLRSVRFREDKPLWDLPQGWRERPGNQFRFATLEIGSSTPPLEMSVTMLGSTGGDQADYILANVNRWRGQLQLPPLTLDQVAEETTEITLNGAAGLSATIVDFEGDMSSRPTGMAGGGPFSLPGGSSPAATKREIVFQRPEGWEPGERVRERGGIRIEYEAAFEIRDGDERVDVTVTSLPASNLLANVNRWRREVQLEEITAEELSPQPIPFGDVSGQYVELIGAQQAILGVVAVDGGTAWFAKLKGESERVIRERDRFQEFVRSIEFKD